MEILETKQSSLAPKYPAIGLIAFPLRDPDAEAGQVILNEFINIVAPLSKEILVITGNYFPQDSPTNVKLINVESPVINAYDRESLLNKIRRFLMAEVRVSLKLIQVRRRIDVIFLFTGWGAILLPVLLARVQRKKVVLVPTGSFHQSMKVVFERPLRWVVSPATWLVERIDYYLANRIVVSSEEMIKALGLDRYRNKIFDQGVRRYIDTSSFSIKKRLAERRNIVGYVGRLSAEKGVPELAAAIPLILARRKDVRFMIIGDGLLKEPLKQELLQAGCLNKVDFVGWVPHERLPDFMNEMRLHVLPSHTEELPVVSLEAMACGAIAIGNAVGGITSVIKHHNPNSMSES